MSSLSSHFVEVEGLRLHYTSCGEGPPVLLLHGWPTSAFLYRDISPLIAAQGRRAIALDLPGFGKSDKPLDASYSNRFYDRILNAFADALELGPTGLVVHDLGGPVGLHWMVENPDRVSSVALLNTIVQAKMHWWAVLFLVGARIPGLSWFVTAPWFLKFTMQFGTRSKQGSRPEVVAGVQEPFGTTDARKALLKSIRGLHPAGLKTIEQKLPGMTLPVRMIYGTSDQVLPDVPKVFPRLATTMGVPPENVTALDGCGHFLQEDRPDEVGRLLAEFFAATA